MKLEHSLSIQFPKFSKLDSFLGIDPRQHEDQWTEKYAPTDIDEVAVHKGKIGNVREWLEIHTVCVVYSTV